MGDQDPPYLDPSHELAGLLNPLLALVAPPRRREFDLKSVESLQVDDRIIPSSTLYLFLDFSFEGNLPSGGKTSLQLITEDEVLLLTKPYAEWANVPWNSTSSDLTGRMLNTPHQFHIDVPWKISCMRARLWLGMTPMSGGQWKAKKLDDTANWQSVFEFLLNIIHTFEWLGHPDVQVLMKDSFNHTAKELATFESAINSRREGRGVQGKVDMQALWLEYIKSLFETMVARTHAFFLNSVKATISKARNEYNSAVDAKGDREAHAEAKRCGEIWSDLGRLLHRADSYIMMALDGYTGFTSSPTDSKVVGSLFPLPFRWEIRRGLQDAEPWPITTRHADNPTALYNDRRELLSMFDESNRNHDHVRFIHRGEPQKLEREPWISMIHSRTQWSLSHGGPQDQKWGFVGYMLTHKPTHQEWEVFLSKLYADFHQSGQGVEGFESVKENMDIQWINAKDHGIAHDDIQAAKRHFYTFNASPRMRKRVLKTDFLVIDSECFASYMNPKPPFGSIKCAGDHDGYLKLVDTLPYRSESVSATAPGYRNELRVLGRLVFDDVYPQLSGLVLRPMHFWRQAMFHPYQVYTGFPVKGQMDEWNLMWKARILFWIAFAQWKESRQS